MAGDRTWLRGTGAEAVRVAVMGALPTLRGDATLSRARSKPTKQAATTSETDRRADPRVTHGQDTAEVSLERGLLPQQPPHQISGDKRAILGSRHRASDEHPWLTSLEMA